MKGWFHQGWWHKYKYMGAKLGVYIYIAKLLLILSKNVHSIKKSDEAEVPPAFTVSLAVAIFLALQLTLSWRRPISYRNQSIGLLCKSMEWFLYDNSLRHERVKI